MHQRPATRSRILSPMSRVAHRSDTSRNFNISFRCGGFTGVLATAGTIHEQKRHANVSRRRVAVLILSTVTFGACRDVRYGQSDLVDQEGITSGARSKRLRCSPSYPGTPSARESFIQVHCSPAAALHGLGVTLAGSELKARGGDVCIKVPDTGCWLPTQGGDSCFSRAD